MSGHHPWPPPSKRHERITAEVVALNIPGYGADEIAFFNDAITQLKPTFIAEWGTNVGSSARIFHELTRRNGINAAIHTIEHPDPATHDHPGHRYAEQIRGLPITKHLGDGVNVALEEYAKAGKPAKALFFLDGDHSYDAVTRELEAIVFEAPTAWMIVHDVCHPIEAVEEAVENFIDEWNYDARFLYSQAGVVLLCP